MRIGWIATDAAPVSTRNCYTIGAAERDGVALAHAAVRAYPVRRAIANPIYWLPGCELSAARSEKPIFACEAFWIVSK